MPACSGAMKFAEKKGSLATCGCATGGSTTVLIEGCGAVRAKLDTAKGLIIGGVPSVTVEGYAISVMGDPVLPHGNGRCASARTASPSSTVLVGEGDAARRTSSNPKQVEIQCMLSAANTGSGFISGRTP